MSNTENKCDTPLCVNLAISVLDGEKRFHCKINKHIIENCGWHKTSEQLKKEVQGGLHN